MSKVDIVKQPFEQLHYPTLFEWEILNSCAENNLLECAKFLCQTIVKFNGVSRAYCNLFAEKKQHEKYILKLTERCKYLETCNKCASLQKKLDDHNTKMKTLANIFGQISSETVSVNISTTSKNSLEKAHDIFTQLIDDNDILQPEKGDIPKVLHVSRKVKNRNSPGEEDCSNFNELKECAATFMTPRKRLKIESILSPKKNCPDDHNDESTCNTSPILGKSKMRSIESRTPMRTATYRSEGNTSSITECITKVDTSDENASIKTSTCSHLKSGNSSDEKMTIVKSKAASPVDRIDRIKRHSISLLQKPNIPSEDGSAADVAKRKKSAKCKALKQSRLSFSKPKQQLAPLDISLADNFFGGIRSTSTEYIDDEAMIKAGLQASLELPKIPSTEELRLTQDDEDVINASPSYSHQPVVKWPKKRHQIKKENIEPHKAMDISDDATMLFAMGQKPIKEEIFSEPLDNDLTLLPTTRCNENEIPPDQLKPGIGTVLKNSSPDFMYKELPVRKKADKKKLPGWSCLKCKEFYEVAFAGNEDMIRQKMEDCSRHRGKFNPERRSTPPGFWDLKMPCTEDTEAFNRRNNGD